MAVDQHIETPQTRASDGLVSTVGQLWQAVRARVAGVTAVPELEADRIVCHVLANVQPASEAPYSSEQAESIFIPDASAAVRLHSNRAAPMSQAVAEVALAMAARRAQREPLAYILGYQGFWDADFLVGPATLIPRADSEALVALSLKCLEEHRGSRQRLLDLGTGTGCLLLSLLGALPDTAEGVGVDIQPEAAALAAKNAARLGFGARTQFLTGSWFEPLEAVGPQTQPSAGPGAGFDLILSNPPYIRTDERAGLMPDVRDYEPLTALISGDTGLEAYEHICRAAGMHLREGGWLAFEVGAGQAPDVANLMRVHGFSGIKIEHDLGGIERAVAGQHTRKPV